MSGTEVLVRDGLRLRARTWGPPDGEPVLLQHGRGGDSAGWTGVAEHLVTKRPHGLRYRVVAPDLRGHGASDWGPAHGYSVDVLADDLAAWIEAAFDRPCHLVGHSYGAITALATAARRPDLVADLLLEDGGPASALLIERWGRERALPAARFASEADAEAELERLWPGDTTPANRDRRMAAFFVAGEDGGLTWRSDIPGMAAAPRDPLLLEDSWGLLDRLRCPLTLVVAGTGSMLDPDVAARVRARVPSARVVVVPGAGHDVHSSRPSEFLDVLEGLLVPSSPEVSS